MDLQTLIARSLCYSSGDNCQPFHFQIINDRQFAIYHSQPTAAHRLNLANTASLLSFGGLLETLSLNAKCSGLELQFEFQTKNMQKKISGVWATVTVTATREHVSDEDKLLQEALAIRSTNRGLYKTQPLNETDLLRMTDEANKNPHLRFSFQDTMNSDLKNSILEIEEEAWKDLFLAMALLKWIRFTKRSVRASKDGLTWGSLGIHWINKPLLKLFSLFPILYKIVVNWGATKANRQSLKHQLQFSGGFGWIAVRTNDPLTLIAAGRTISRMWLYLSANGYAYQPLTMATLPSFHSNFCKLSEDWSPILKKLYVQVTQQIQQDLMFNSEWIPIWAFRTGKAKPLAHTDRTLRKPIDQVLMAVGQ